MTALVAVGALLAWYFPIVFFFRSDWNANSPGRAQMAFSTIVAVVMTLVLLRQLGITLPEEARIVVYGAIVLGLAIQDFTLTKAQNRRSARISRERESIKETS